MLRKFLTVGFDVANPIGLLLVKALVVAAVVVKLEIGSLYTSSFVVGLPGSARFDACLLQKPSFKARTENRTVSVNEDPKGGRRLSIGPEFIRRTAPLEVHPQHKELSIILFYKQKAVHHLRGWEEP